MEGKGNFNIRKCTSWKRTSALSKISVEFLKETEILSYLNLACPQSVYHWQAGRTLPNIDNFYALSVLLGTTVNDLVVERNCL